MASIRNTSFFKKFQGEAEKKADSEKKDKEQSEITTINFHKRRRDEANDDFENALTNGRSTIFQTKTQREARSTLNISPSTGLSRSSQNFVLNHHGLSK